jgi:small subunit ribosomal protein S21
VRKNDEDCAIGSGGKNRHRPTRTTNDEPRTARIASVASIKGTHEMPVIKIKDNESFEGAMKRFKKTCEKAGILTELRRREYYDKPSIRKKKKEAASRKRALKKLRRSMN